ncbi:hypothetical protein, partial [Escherichia coli]|uniref:hypothetical protein n=1 Tax=Escherichia coli TaxID=562 RepID=UPI0019541A61
MNDDIDRTQAPAEPTPHVSLLVVLNAEDGAVPRGVVRWVLVDVVKLDLEAASLADAARPFMGIHHARRDLGRNGRSDLGH